MLVIFPGRANLKESFPVKHVNMASLVADYGISSGSDDECDGNIAHIKVTDSSDNGTDTRINFLTSDIVSDSEEEECQEQSDEYAVAPTLPNPLTTTEEQARLPPPDLTSPGSVFANPYLKAEEVKHSILEQHVKMTEQEKQIKRSRQICWNFYKGRCRYGKKCKYSHDMDSVAKKEKLVKDPPCSTVQHGKQSTPVDDEESSTKRKKRIGVTNTLLPPKKALKALQQQRQQERPWTVQN